MAKSETTNAHLHKVLTHRNYMHHVTLQKQLNIYDKQKKLVERELLQITKVREAIQHMNKSFPTKSQGIKKRGSTACHPSKKSKFDSSMKSGKIFEQRKERFREHGVFEDGIANGDDGENKVNEEKLFGSKDENIVQSSIHSSPKQSERDYATRGELAIDSKAITTSIDNQNQVKPSTANDRLFTRRAPPYMKSCSSPSLPVQKLDEIVENEATREEQRETYRSTRTPTRNENKALYASSDEDLCRKSLPTVHANAETRVPGTKAKEQCEIYRLQKTPTTLAKDRGGYAHSDEDLYRKSLLVNHANAGTRLPILNNIGGSDGTVNRMVNTSNFVNNVQSLEAEKNKKYGNSSPNFGAFQNNDVCFVQRSRPRSKTVSDLEIPKPKTAWNSPGTQRRIFANRDVCVIDRPRTRAKTVCHLDNRFSEFRPRSKTESCNVHPGNHLRTARDSNGFSENPRPRSMTVTGTNENWTKAGVKSTAGMEHSRYKSQSCESVLSEDESIAIMGKFRQIGHSVLAIALMKKMAKK